jgi:hypothetical protein
MDVWAFPSASWSLNPSFLKSVKFDPSSVRRFLLSDNNGREILVREPLLKSFFLVRVDRSGRMIGIGLGKERR